MNTYWKSSGRLQLHLDMLDIRAMTWVYDWGLWPIVFLKTRHNKLDFLLTKPLSVCVCMRACVCLDLVLLLVRWVSVKRITTVSLLYPHTLSQRPTFTRPTFHAIQPPSSAPFNSALKNRESYLEYERQDNIFSNSDSVVEAGLKWSTYVCFLCVPLTNNPFRKVWMFLFLIWIKNNKHKSTLINIAANILLVQRYIYSFPSVLLWSTVCSTLCIFVFTKPIKSNKKTF